MTIDLRDKVESWLRQQGYPLEMVVARNFKDTGFDVSQSDYYQDPETGKFREIDVAARIADFVFPQVDSQRRLFVALALLVECKLSQDKPWVLFAGSTSPGASPLNRPASEVATALIKRFRDAWGDTLLGGQGRPPAYGVTQAFTSGSDVAYAACHSAVKAASAELIPHRQYTNTAQALVAVSIPIVVVDGRLFEARLTSDEVLAVDEVDSGLTVWREQWDEGHAWAVDIVTKKALPDFVRRARTTFLQLQKLVLISPELLTGLDQPNA